MKKRAVSFMLVFALTLSLAGILCACGSSSDAPAPLDTSPADGFHDNYTDSPSIDDGYSDFSEETYPPEEYLEEDEEETEERFDLSVGPLLVDILNRPYQQGFSTGFTIMQMDLSDGSMNTVFSFTNPMQDGNRGPFSFAFNIERQNYLPSYFPAQLFDSGMTKLAVRWYEAGDSSNHVGWVDREGNLTDVTQLVHPHTADFSSRVPHDSNALFAPDGSFFFVDNNDECYCYFDTETMSIIKTEPLIVYHGAYFDTTYDQVTFKPDGSICGLWHTEDRSYGGADAIQFGDCLIALPMKRSFPTWTTWDYIEGDVILCIRGDSEGYYIAEIGRGIGTPREPNYKYSKPLYNGSYYGAYSDEDCLSITPKTDYTLMSAAYYDGQIAFIGSRGQERYLFTVENEPNSNPKLIAPVESSWDILFW